MNVQVIDAVFLCPRRLGRKPASSNWAVKGTPARVTRVYTCETCGVAFERNSSLWNHRKTHSEVRPYKCSFCGRQFKWKNGLRIHAEVHKRKQEIRNVEQIADLQKSFRGAKYPTSDKPSTDRPNYVVLNGEQASKTYARQMPYAIPSMGRNAQAYAFAPYVAVANGTMANAQYPLQYPQMACNQGYYCAYVNPNHGSVMQNPNHLPQSEPVRYAYYPVYPTMANYNMNYVGQQPVNPNYSQGHMPYGGYYHFQPLM